MTRDGLLNALEVERQDRTFWRLMPAPTTQAAEQRRAELAARENDADVMTRRRELMAATAHLTLVEGVA